MTKEEYLNALETISYVYGEGAIGLYDNVGKGDLFTKKELDQAHELLSALIRSAKKQIKKMD